MLLQVGDLDRGGVTGEEGIFSTEVALSQAFIKRGSGLWEVRFKKRGPNRMMPNHWRRRHEQELDNSSSSPSVFKPLEVRGESLHSWGMGTTCSPARLISHLSESSYPSIFSLSFLTPGLQAEEAAS